jgi:hypothetical protein
MIAAPLAPAAAQYVPVPLVNPSFEAGLTGWNPASSGGGSASTIAACGATDGTSCAVLSTANTTGFALSKARISQTVTALNAHVYEIRFDYRFVSLPEPGSLASFTVQMVTIFDQLLTSAFGVPNPEAADCVAVWCEAVVTGHFRPVFGPDLPVSAALEIELVSFPLLPHTIGGATTLWLDNVRLGASVSAVPEPTTWDLLAGGLLALGGVRCRRKRAA